MFGFKGLIGKIGIFVNLLLFVTRHQTFGLHNRRPKYNDKIPSELIDKFIQIEMEDIEYPKNIQEFGDPFVFKFHGDLKVTMLFQTGDEINMTFNEMFEMAKLFDHIPSEHNYTLYCINAIQEEFENPAFNTSFYIRVIIASRILCNLMETFTDTKYLTKQVKYPHQINNNLKTGVRIPENLRCLVLDTQNWDYILRSGYPTSFERISLNLDTKTRKIVQTIEPVAVVESVAEPEQIFSNNQYGKWSLFQDIFVPGTKKEYLELFEGEQLPRSEHFESKEFRERWFEKCLSLIDSKHPGRVTDKFRKKARLEFDLNWEWVSRNRPNTFIENSNLCEFLMESSCNVRVESILVETEGFVYSFSIPNDYKFKGIDIPPFLVKCEKDETQTKIQMTILFRSGFFMGISDISTVSYDELVESYSNYTWRSYMGISKMSGDYVKFIIAAAKKLTIMTLLYKQAHPEKFVDGYPYIHTSEIAEKPRESKPKVLSLDKRYLEKKKKTEDGVEPRISPHWRRAHFATLRHEKFQRNLDGSVKVILRRGSDVNFDRLKPKTLKV